MPAANRPPLLFDGTYRPPRVYTLYSPTFATDSQNHYLGDQVRPHGLWDAICGFYWDSGVTATAGSNAARGAAVGSAEQKARMTYGADLAIL
jgi:hypothetical protein